MRRFVLPVLTLCYSLASADGPANLPVELGLMWPTFPTSRPPSYGEIELGREIFGDASLSSDGKVRCATCHDEASAFADKRPVARGVRGKPGKRNSPTLWNIAFADHFSWDGRHNSLEEQALAALTNPDEMGFDNPRLSLVLQHRYGSRLKQLYGDATPAAAVRALGAYQRTLLAGDSPFDRYLFGRDESAIDVSSKRGLKLFLGKARCVQCHLVRSELSHPFGGSTAMLMDNRFHNIGIGFSRWRLPSDLGRWEVTKREEDRGAFRTPTLRNVELTAPYMHDGSLRTLKDVIDHYDKGGIPNPNLDIDVAPLHLSDSDKVDLVSLLQTFTSYKLQYLRDTTPDRRPTARQSSARAAHLRSAP